MTVVERVAMNVLNGVVAVAFFALYYVLFREAWGASPEWSAGAAVVLTLLVMQEPKS